MKRVFIYNLSEVVSKDFKDYFKAGVEIYPDEFDHMNYYDYDFSDELVEAIEKQTGKKIDDIDTEIINTIANNIVFEAYQNACYTGFYEFIAKEYNKNFGYVIDAGNELVDWSCKDIFDLDSYTFKLDFSKLDKEDKKYYIELYERPEKKYLLDFLNYDFSLFEKYIEKKLSDLPVNFIVNFKVLNDTVKEALENIEDYLSYAYELVEK